MKKTITTILLIIFCVLILSLSLRGIFGNPDDQTINEPYWTNDGPLELSPERGKFALTYSIVENNSVNFSIPIARFVTPDLGYYNGLYVSLFAPGVSYITIPGYIIGRQFGLSQVGTYTVIALFALLNVLLIRLILIRFSIPNFIATISGITFLFATPAFAYSASLYQHHISTFIILLSLYLLIKFKGVWPLLAIWFLLGASLTVDSPNLILTAPLGLFALGRLVYVKSKENKLKIGVKLLGFLTVVTALIPLFFLAQFNQLSYGNPFQLSGTVASVKVLDEQGKPADPEDKGSDDSQYYTDPSRQNKSAVEFFHTRNILNGFYIHFFSPDRSILYYSPVILLGMLGIYFLYKKNGTFCALLTALMGVNILLYSMWGDPWGGWAFGSRYLIPTYAMLSILLGFALLHLNRYLLFSLLFFGLFTYSVGVNAVGAITSSRNPPQVEVLGLEKLSGVEEKYTFDRNFGMLNVNKSKSFVFNSFANKFLSAWQYYFLLVCMIVIPAATLLAADKLFRGGIYVKD